MNQFFKLKQPTVNTSPQQKPIANTSKSNEMIPFSTMDFFDRFVRQANDKKLLKTPLPTPLSKQHILLSSIQLLQASQLDKKDVRIEEDNYGGTIMITQRGLDKVQDFLSFRLQDKAATTIQKVWRGYRVRAKNQEFMYFEQYIQTLSLMYYDILNANRTSGPKLAPTQKELDFMKKLNHPETYRICQDYLLLLAEMEENPRKQDHRMTILPGNQEYQNTMLMYQEYAPKVLEWIGQVLKIQFKPNQDFLFIMRSGDLLCRLACALYQNVDCHLLDKGLEFGVHKIIFFLELCKSLHIKRSLLFQVSDILVWPDHDPHRKHALIVLRTIIALEKHARKSGWEGPPIELRQQASMSLGVSSRESVIRKTQSSDEHLRQVANPQPPMQARRPSIPVNFNAPPPPVAPPVRFRTNSQDSINIESRPTLQDQKRGSNEKMYEYQPRRRASKTGEMETVKESARVRKVSFDISPRTDIAPRHDSLRNQDMSSNEKLQLSKGSSEDLHYRSSSGDSTIPMSMIPLATQVQGQNYEDSSDNDSLSDQISEMSAMMKESMVRKPDVESVQDQKKVLEEAIKLRITLRSKNIQEFITEERTYMGNLSNVADYLNTLIKQRRRTSSLVIAQPEGEKGKIPLPMNVSLSGTSLRQLPNETDRAFKFRLETEIEEMVKLSAVIQSMVELQSEFLDSLTKCEDDLIGDAVSQFVSGLNRPYTTYSVVALSGMNKTHLSLTTRGEVEQSEFVNRIVNKYVSSALVSEQSDEPTEQDWSWFLKRPIQRLRSYPKFLSVIHGEIRMKLNPAIDLDNKKLRIASIKINCIADAIEEHLDSKQ